MSWRWIDKRLLLILHDESLAEHGGDAFVDGNKRAALLSAGLFLALNGHRLVASQPDATLTMLSVASGDTDEPEFARWIRANSVPR